MKCAFTCTVYCDSPFWRKNLQCGKKYCFILLYKLNIHIFHSLYQHILHLMMMWSVLYVHQHWAHICQLIIKIMFQMQTRELNPALKSFICRIQQPMTTNNVVYCYIRSIYIWLVKQTSGSSVTSCRKIVKCTFHLSIMLSVLLWNTYSDYPFGTSKLFIVYFVISWSCLCIVC